MSDNDQENRFLNRIKKTLDDGTDRLDPGVQSRLNRIRKKAMQSKSGRWFPDWTYQPAMQWGSVACALLLGILYFSDPGKTQLEPGLEDFDLLASADMMELYEDLEFYTWLAEESVDEG